MFLLFKRLQLSLLPSSSICVLELLSLEMLTNITDDSLESWDADDMLLMMEAILYKSFVNKTESLAIFWARCTTDPIHAVDKFCYLLLVASFAH